MVYKAHAVEHLGSDKIALHLGYPFVNYELADTVPLQKKHYLVDRERSKYYGKFKVEGKHLRLALNFQNIGNAFAPDITIERWNRYVSKECLEAAMLVGHYQDQVAACFAEFVKERSQSSTDQPREALWPAASQFEACFNRVMAIRPQIYVDKDLSIMAAETNDFTTVTEAISLQAYINACFQKMSSSNNLRTLFFPSADVQNARNPTH